MASDDDGHSFQTLQGFGPSRRWTIVSTRRKKALLRGISRPAVPAAAAAAARNASKPDASDSDGEIDDGLGDNVVAASPSAPFAASDSENDSVSDA